VTDSGRQDAYSQAVSSGRYTRQTGLHGKYDNVRLYWEDDLTRLFLRPHVDRLTTDREKSLSRLRILDLGCGSGDGYEMLMNLFRHDPGIYDDEIRVILPDRLGLYRGLDKNADLLAQTRQRWLGTPKLLFEEADFSAGLPVEEGDPAYDVYYSSFGALSHLAEDQTVRLFSDIVRHADSGALVMGDWLGRYSYEWQDLWETDTEREQWMDYAISYIYPPGEERPEKLDHLRLRLLCRDEVQRVLARVEEETGCRLEVKAIFDRSLFVGRHMDTADYNGSLRPMRHAVNRLHEDNKRTVLDNLILDYRPHGDFDFLNGFFEHLQSCWNALVRYSIDICRLYDSEAGVVRDAPAIPAHYPEPLKTAMGDMKRVVEGAGWFRMGDPRANVIEPQLGYALRGLEYSLQQGRGCGHGLVGVFEVRKG
jgi:SAM-dependent methyltransferase